MRTCHAMKSKRLVSVVELNVARVATSQANCYSLFVGAMSKRIKSLDPG